MYSFALQQGSLHEHQLGFLQHHVGAAQNRQKAVHIDVLCVHLVRAHQTEPLIYPYKPIPLLSCKQAAANCHNSQLNMLKVLGADRSPTTCALSLKHVSVMSDTSDSMHAYAWSHSCIPIEMRTCEYVCMQLGSTEEDVGMWQLKGVRS